MRTMVIGNDTDFRPALIKAAKEHKHKVECIRSPEELDQAMPRAADTLSS